MTDAIKKLLGEEGGCGPTFRTKHYDRVSKPEYLQVTIEYALIHPGLKDPLLDYLVTEFGQHAKKILRVINK